jgi:hypothetical protein
MVRVYCGEQKGRVRAMSGDRIGAKLRAWLVLLALGSVPAMAAPAAPGDSPARTTGSDRSEHIKVGVYVLDFDPLIDGGQPLSVAQGWNDPFALEAQYVADVGTASGGIVSQRLVRTSQIRDFPVKADGFRFTDATYHACLVNSPPLDYCKGLIDYAAVLNTEFDPRVGSACEALQRGRVDEVWLWGGPWFGYLEQILVAPHTLCPRARQPFVVMGFSYERGEAEMLHDLGHRAEALIQAGIGYSLWDRFDGQRTRYGQDFACPLAPDAGHPEVDPPVGHAGNVHFPPNAYCHYQYDRDFPVLSDAYDWANFPDLTGRQTIVNANTWGGTQRGFLMWWMALFPRHAGETGGVERDWWRYVYVAKGSDRGE